MELLGGRIPSIDFVGKRKISFAVSGAIVLLGLAAFVAILLGRANLGIDFVGGVAVQARFEQPVTLGAARQALDAAGFAHAEVQGFEGDRTLLVRVKGGEGPINGIADRIVAALKQGFPSNPLTVESSSTIGPTVGAALKRDALVATVLSLGAIVLYLAFRFSSARFGVTATLATFHDVLAMLGVFWLLGKEIDLLLVVALLTIAGYSLTDTVVVFDRIRETLARGRQPADRVINRSINEVLSRTIVTALTTFISSLCLLFFGGEVLRDFALALTIGIVVGTYSSIFVAAPILYVWGLPSARPAGAPAPASRPAQASGRPVRREGVPTR